MQKLWMDQVTTWTVSWLQTHSMDANSLNKEDMDKCMNELQHANMPSISSDHSHYKKYALFSPGTFKDWLSKNHPDEFAKIFGQLPKPQEKPNPFRQIL
ncbi:hypothetical protein HZC21_01395 [Candidatus Peregrinibacteria bacterium]|nr:hypothetical protein [Candidatus Peregrinibacteria bacterium]